MTKYKARVPIEIGDGAHMISVTELEKRINKGQVQVKRALSADGRAIILEGNAQLYELKFGSINMANHHVVKNGFKFMQERLDVPATIGYSRFSIHSIDSVGVEHSVWPSSGMGETIHELTITPILLLMSSLPKPMWGFENMMEIELCCWGELRGATIPLEGDIAESVAQRLGDPVRHQTLYQSQLMKQLEAYQADMKAQVETLASDVSRASAAAEKSPRGVM